MDPKKAQEKLQELMDNLDDVSVGCPPGHSVPPCPEEFCREDESCDCEACWQAWLDA
jgi:hypothetical protein